MNKYDEVLKFMKEKDVDIVRLYIYDITKSLGDDAIEATEAVYNEWLDIDEDVDLAKLTDLIVENWVAYKEYRYTTDDIYTDLF